MGSNGQLPPGSQTDTRFLSLFAELEKIGEDYTAPQLAWYKTHAQRPMFLFRICGVFIIFLSISLPFLATQMGFWKEVILPIFSLAIAVLSSLNAFFHWDSDWRAYRQTQFALEGLLVSWQLSMTEAKYETDVQKAIEMITQATKQLTDDTQRITGTETEQYFKDVQIPSTLHP